MAVPNLETDLVEERDAWTVQYESQEKYRQKSLQSIQGICRINDELYFDDSKDGGSRDIAKAGR
jgi:hypothetical protein